MSFGKSLLLLILCLIGVTLFAESTSTFEVKELDSAVVANLNTAELKLDAAMKVLQKAQQDFEAAKQSRDGIESNIKAQFHAAEGECIASSHESDMSLAWPTGLKRSFVRVEIRGKYALITSGTEACSNGLTIMNSYSPGIIFTDPNGTMIGNTLGNTLGRNSPLDPKWGLFGN